MIETRLVPRITSTDGLQLSVESSKEAQNTSLSQTRNDMISPRSAMSNTGYCSIFVATKPKHLGAVLLLFVANATSRVNCFVHQQHGLARESIRRPFRGSRLLVSKENEPSSLNKIVEGVFPDRASSNLKSEVQLSSGRTSLLLIQAEAILTPAAQFLDEKTGGWALSYADLKPESEQSPIGLSFLATNIAYAIVGLLLSSQGETLLGFMTEIVSIASFCYHYTQLQRPYNRTKDSTVRLALTVDYILAITSIFIGLIYLLTDQTLPPIEGVISSVLGIICLLGCWRWEQGLPYIVLHSLWHIFSAVSAYSIGNAHIMA